ncbi:MAG: PhoH family protein [Gammaproteobacteria bacterium]|nr:MAG: PhoH family protein [Gammaproteobacteria bacterium]
MSRKHGRAKRQKNKLQQLDYMSEDNVVIDFHPSQQQDSYSPSQSQYPHSHHSRSSSAIKLKPIQAKNKAQDLFMAAIKTHTLIFGLGPAGTGKSYCTAAMAAQALLSGTIDRVIFTRPAVEAGNSMGFLPGKLDEKFDPYFSAFKSCLVSNAGKGVIECAIKNGNISIEPLAYMRGKTFNRAFIVLDEAQNCSPDEIKMFMTRIGMNSTVVINGDLSQKDIRCYSGLHDAIKRVHRVKGVYVHEFDYQDIVRSDIVKDIIMCYDDVEQKVKEYRSDC